MKKRGTLGARCCLRHRSDLIPSGLISYVMSPTLADRCHVTFVT